MKKVYNAPDILFESFTMSTNIAGDCGTIIDNQGKGVCAMIGTGGINIFTSTITACVFTPTDMGGPVDDQWDNICYYNPIDETNLFAS